MLALAPVFAATLPLRSAAPARRPRQLAARAAAPEVANTLLQEITQAVDATLHAYQSGIEQLKSSYEVEQATQQAVQAPPAPAASHAPLANGRREIGQTLPDGSILFRDLDTCCGHAMGTDAEGNVTFHFD